MDTMFRMVLSQMSQANSARLLPWFLPTAAKSSTGPTCSVSEALISVTTSELEGTTAPASMSSPALTLGLKCKKWDCSPGTTPEGQSGKRDHADTKEGSVSSEHSTPSIQPKSGDRVQPKAPAATHLTLSSLISPLMQSRLPPTPMKRWL